MPEHITSFRDRYRWNKPTADWLWSMPIVEFIGRGYTKQYRYWKLLEIDPSIDKRMVVVLLSPTSMRYKAKRIITEERLIARARLLGYGYVGIVYMFARKLDSYELWHNLRYEEPTFVVGEMNDEFMGCAFAKADMVVFAYGKAPKNRFYARLINIRSSEVYTTAAAFFLLPMAFDITMDEWPAGPLMIPFSEPLKRWYPPEKEPVHPMDTKEPSIRLGVY